MPNYKEMYFTLARSVGLATDILITAQRKCEEMYINPPESEFKVLEMPTGEGEPADEKIGDDE